MTVWRCWRDPGHEPIATTEFGWPQCTVCRAAPPYHDRPDYLPEGFALSVYVPHDWRATAILAAHSGVVGHQIGNGEWISVYYEGWINGPMQYADRDVRGLWEAGVEHAAGRMITGYPTSACAHLPKTALHRIGTYFPKTRELFVLDEEALDAWLNQ